MPRGLERDSSSEESEEEKKNLMPVKDVSENSILSERRILELLKAGKVNGELHLDEGRGGRGKWYTTVEEVEEYKKNLPTPEELGRKGGLIAGRGRPKSASS